MIEKLITFAGQPARVACDGNCSKAWGIQYRPRISFDPKDPDDYAYLADHELGEAPADSGIYEGGHAKPRTDDEKPNKWCVRQCERMEMSDPGESAKPVRLRVFTERVYNQPWKHRAEPFAPGQRVEAHLPSRFPPGVRSNPPAPAPRTWIAVTYAEDLGGGRHRVVRDALPYHPTEAETYRSTDVSDSQLRTPKGT